MCCGEPWTSHDYDLGMQGKRGFALVLLASSVLAACASTSSSHTSPAPCRILRLKDAQTLLGADATLSPLSGTRQNPVCTYTSGTAGNLTPASIVLHLTTRDGSTLLKSISTVARSPVAQPVRLRGLNGNAFWIAGPSPTVLAGSQPAAGRVEGLLVFVTAAQLVQIDVGNSPTNLAIAKAAGEIVTSRLR
jgi:hypothetical protein